MPTVTVPGANHSTVTLSFDRDANALLALHVAGAIGAGIANNTIFPFDNKAGLPPPPPAGETGEFVQSKSGTTFLPTGYDYVVDAAKSADIFGNGDKNQQVLAGSGDLKFFATGGSGTIVTGGGKDMISIAPSDSGPWLIQTGNGNDTIRALGGGADTIGVGSGEDLIQLGSGKTFLTMNGSDTVLAGSGRETIDASGSKGSTLIYGNSSQLLFVAGGPATVYGGTGSDTVYGGSGKDLLEGGTAGHNFLQAGAGRATLFGGGDGDQLYAAGSKAQALHAASGNETLSGVGASGRDTFYGGSGSDLIFGGSGKNTFVAGTGTATVAASPGSMNVFELMKTMGGGHELVTDLTDASQVHIALSGYGSSEIAYALAHQSVKDGSVTVTLSDHTQVTFQNIGKLSSGNFTDSGSGGSGDGWGDSGHHWGPSGDR